ncbi:MAG: 4-hydroxythreonine-4-phosphate dehydrogenase PdxA [Desulfobacterales bacterium]|nr:4-hydroxythreonine-4-phosphate dehydrogenase PdxA [Desulfobacterales bacterium]
MKQIPTLALTMGDPCGIGPEIAAKAMHTLKDQKALHLFLIGDIHVMEQAIALVQKPLTLNPIDHPSQAKFTPGCLNILPVSDLSNHPLTTGVPTAETGKAMVDSITKAVDLAMDGSCHGVVTGPIHKVALKLSGSEFHGHTELLASRTKSKEFAMMMAGDRLKVVLATIHIPLSEVVQRLSTQKITDLIGLTSRSLKERFGIRNPRIGVAGLNPHAGEEGLFGDEESRIISPAVARARQLDPQSIISDPMPPDTIFFKAAEGHFDAVVCMYHDQGLIPFKMVHFHDGVNTTLGLPIIRTSVDHGTAYDIAWKNRADEGSLLAAIRMAANQAKHLIQANTPL